MVCAGEEGRAIINHAQGYSRHYTQGSQLEGLEESYVMLRTEPGWPCARKQTSYAILSLQPNVYICCRTEKTLKIQTK